MEENEEFSICGHGGDILTIAYAEVYGFPDETCHWGGYDVRAKININAGDFSVVSDFYTTTGEVFGLYKQFVNCNEKVMGTVAFASYEGNVKFTATYDFGGRIEINGTFRANGQFGNELCFEIITDQTYIQSTIAQMKQLIDKYGDDKGVFK